MVKGARVTVMMNGGSGRFVEWFMILRWTVHWFRKKNKTLLQQVYELLPGSGCGSDADVHANGKGSLELLNCIAMNYLLSNRLWITVAPSDGALLESVALIRYTFHVNRNWYYYWYLHREEFSRSDIVTEVRRGDEKRRKRIAMAWFLICGQINLKVSLPQHRQTNFVENSLSKWSTFLLSRSLVKCSLLLSNRGTRLLKHANWLPNQPSPNRIVHESAQLMNVDWSCLTWGRGGSSFCAFVYRKGK